MVTQRETEGINQEIGFTYAKNLLYSTETSIPYTVMTHMGKESKKRVVICIKLIHFAVQQKLTQHCKSTILQ